MKKLAIALVLFLVFGLTACAEKPEPTEPQPVSAEQMYEASNKTIEVETQPMDVEEIPDTVEITVKLPDYEKLYRDAWAAEDPDRYLLDAMESGKYEVIEYTVEAEVTVEDGKTIVHTEEAVKKLQEQLLVDAIRVLIEEEE